LGTFIHIQIIIQPLFLVLSSNDGWHAQAHISCDGVGLGSNDRESVYHALFVVFVLFPYTGKGKCLSSFQYNTIGNHSFFCHIFPIIKTVGWDKAPSLAQRLRRSSLLYERFRFSIIKFGAKGFVFGKFWYNSPIKKG